MQRYHRNKAMIPYDGMGFHTASYHRSITMMWMCVTPSKKPETHVGCDIEHDLLEFGT
jgi:hypothetical protein